MHARVSGSLRLPAIAALAPVSAMTGSPSPADPGDARHVARGAGVYAEACAFCHGAALEGQVDWRSPKPDGTYPAPPHDAEGHTWHHPDSVHFHYRKLGGAEALGNVSGARSGMPGFAGTPSDQDIWYVLAFIKSHWLKEMRQ